jgi:hypothetical protein
MTKIRETLATALAGVFGLPLDARELWPDIILGSLLAWALIFSLAALLTFAFDVTFFVSTLASLVIILLANRKRAVVGAALLCVGLRSLIAVALGFQWNAIILALISFGFGGGLLLWGVVRTGRAPVE